MSSTINATILQELRLEGEVIIRVKTGRPQPFVLRKNKYLFCTIKRKTVYMHRAIWVLQYGPIPFGMEIDHIDGNPSNNNLKNLRLCKRAENCQNTRVRTDNSSGFKGVFWDNYSKSWRASIWKDKKKHDLGRFSSLSQAAMVAAIARANIHGDFAKHCSPNKELS